LQKSPAGRGGAVSGTAVAFDGKNFVVIRDDIDLEEDENGKDNKCPENSKAPAKYLETRDAWSERAQF
jgi:hypothetical protein